MNGMAELARAIVGDTRKARSSEHLATVLRKGADGTYWVHIPGGADQTPVYTTMTEASEGDTVRVAISGGRAVMTGNVSSPSANVRTVTKVGGIANMALTTAYSESARIDRLVATSLTADSAVIRDLQSETAKIESLSADQIAANMAYIDDLSASAITVEDLNTVHGMFNDLEAEYADIMHLDAGQINAVLAYVSTLNAANITAESIDADHAAIANLSADRLDATYAHVDLANIHAAEVDSATMKALFAQSGWFEDLTLTGDGVITGKLTAVEIDGDSARFKNIYADALKLLGEDGLYHALNLAGLSEGQAQALVDAYGEDLEDGLHGSRIIAESITADKIDVTSLVAAMLLAQAVQIGASGGTHIEARGDRFSFFAGGYGWESLSDEYLYQEVENPAGSPVGQGWYEIVDGSYVATSDQSVVQGKTYYRYMVTPESALPGEVAYIAVDRESQESMFYMTRSMVVKDLRFGNWMWYGRRNRNMSLKWIGA